jgi:hypothetical protein
MMTDMRKAGLAVLTALALGACHRHGAADADAASSARGLQVEAYDPVIPKAPLKGKLETMAQHPEDQAAPAPVVPAASSEPPAADSSQAPAPKG